MKGLFNSKFKYKNIIIVSLFSLIVTIIFTFTILNIINIRNSNKKMVESESRTHIRVFESSINLSKQLVNSVRFSKEAETWANSYTGAAETYSLIKTMELLNRQLSMLTGGECYVGAWKLGSENASVFFEAATISEERLFENILGIKPEDRDVIVERLRQTGECVILYDETTNHDSFIKLYYENYKDGEIVYFTLIPYRILDVNDTHWFLKSGENLVGTNDIDKYDTTLGTYKKDQYFKIPYTETTGYGLKYFYVRESVSVYFVIAMIVMILLLCALILYLILKLMSIVYEPINRIIDDLEISNDGKYIDEIKLFQESIIEVNLLNNKLESIKDDISLRTNERKYFNLLMGYSEDIDYGIDNFCISLFEFDAFENNDKIFYVCNDLQVYASKDENAIFIQLDKAHVLFIHKVSSYIEAEKMLTNILHNYASDVNVKIALTDMYGSVEKIPVAYELANKILNFKYYFQEKDIILFSDISNIVVNEYNFSVNVEYNLIYKVLNGDETALEIFDKFLRENISNKDISKSTTENYILALINMVNRIFSELKIAPIDLVGYNISFTEWILMKENPNIVFIIRNTLNDIIVNINEKNRTGNKETTEKILNYIHENYMKDIMLVDINTEFGISPQRVNTIFKDELDSNFKTYLNEYRIKVAQKIQREDKNIKTTELYELVGFNSSTSFIRVYKKYTGISPQEYQKTL